jgi:hypothetical protein
MRGRSCRSACRRIWQTSRSCCNRSKASSSRQTVDWEAMMSLITLHDLTGRVALVTRRSQRECT